MGQVRKPTTWSYSSLSRFEECPQRYFWEKVEKRPVPPSPHLERGNHIHAQFERALRADATEAGVPAVSLIEYVAALKLRRPIVEEMWHFDRRWNFLGTEFRPTSWLLVKMDAYVPPVVGRKAKNAHVVDWKTGKKYDDHEKQAEIYALAAAAREGVERCAEVDIDMVYVDQAHIEKWSLPAAEVFDEATAEWSERAEKMLTAREYPAKPNRFCNWCPFSRGKGGPCRVG